MQNEILIEIIGTLFGTILAIFLTILAGIFTYRSQLQIEKKKETSLRSLEESKTLKLQIAEAIKLMTNLIHQMTWVTWYVMKLKNNISVDKLEDYNNMAHLLLPEISGKVAIIAASDQECYKRVREVEIRIYDLDIRIGSAILDLTKQKADLDYKIFETMKKDANDLLLHMSNNFLGILDLAEKNVYAKYKLLETK